jgi:hypothetical protein
MISLLLNKFLSSIDTGTRSEQYCFHLLVEVFIDPPTSEETRKALAEIIARAGQALPDPCSPIRIHRPARCGTIFGFEETCHSGRLSIFEASM